MIIVQRIIITISIILVVIFSVLGIKYSDYEKSFEETLTANHKTVFKITMEIGGVSKSTTNVAKIDELFEYFGNVTYRRMRGDQTAYMPTKAYIIYLHEKDYIDFVVPYNDEAMISYKVYKVKNGEITNDFLTRFYNSLEPL